MTCIRRALHINLHLLALAALAYVHCKPSEQEQARHLVHAVEGIDVEAQLPKRKSQLKRLQELEVTVGELSQAQQLCASAHATLIRAEATQADAEIKVGKLEGRDGLSIERIAVVAKALKKAEALLQQAKQQMPTCEHAVRSVKLRYSGVQD